MQTVELSGIVTKFEGNGRKLGYPTANLRIPTELEDGVYFGFADLSVYKNKPALIFVGVPTTMGDRERRVEVHLLDINDEDYYGQSLRLTVEYFHRPNQTFDSVDELQQVMHEDEHQAREWFGIA